MKGFTRKNMFPETSGVYEVINKTTSERYVGSTNNFYQRLGNQKRDLVRGVNSCRGLQEAWVKWGPDVFEFVVLEFCAVEELRVREQYWLNLRRQYYGIYNLFKSTVSSLGYKVPQEMKDKLKEEKPWVLDMRSRNMTEVNKRQEIRGARSRQMKERSKLPEFIAQSIKNLEDINNDAALKRRLRERLREMNRSPEHIAKIRAAAERRRLERHG